MRLEGCKELYKTFQKLEAKHRDRIWSRIIKNSFAPLFAGRFDYVIGNPPWIRWDNLPQPYREITIEVWKKYGLLKQTTGAGLGKIKKDIAMLFVTVAVDRYLHPNGVLGFLLPFTIFKNQAGAGFRAFLYNKTNVRLIHDMVELMPFEDSINRTSMIILKQGTSNFPLNSTTWRKKSSGSMSNLSLKEVKEKSETHDIEIEPIEGVGRPESSWLMAKAQAIVAIRKGLVHSKSYEVHDLIIDKDAHFPTQYNASAGVFTGIVVHISNGFCI